MAVLAIGVLGTLAAAAPPTNPRTFPYKAYVTANDVYVRSGPGENYYPTEKVKAGTEVEVYRHDPGGWYAIRPLPDSFTWVSGRYLKPGTDGLAEVVGDAVAARVGSQFSDIRDVHQVRLDRGEIVELRGTKQVGTGPGAVTWYRISPPSGEFRWISGKYVDRDYPQDGLRKTGGEVSPLVQPQRAGVQNVSSTAASMPAPAPKGAAGRFSPAAGALAASPPTAAGAVEVPAAAMRHASPEEFQGELDDISAELSIMLAEEPTVWNCGELTRRSQALLDQAQTAVERGSARLLATRIAQAEDIRRRYDAVAEVRSDTERRNQQLADIARTRSALPRAQRAEDRFDGVGRLTRVVPPTLGAPRYALVDERGDVRCYVNPAPGVNMNYYIGRQVGVSGVRTFNPEQRAEIVTAKHVSALDTRLR
jgi:hypothetical protein